MVSVYLFLLIISYHAHPTDAMKITDISDKF